MKSLLRLVPFLVMLLCLAGCDPVGIVKEGIMEMDKSVTVGDAFDNYKYFKSVKWESLEDDQGRTIVECSGMIKDSNFRLDVQFTIMKDGKTFELSYAGLWKGEKEIARGGTTYLQNIYDNEVLDCTLLKFELLKNNSHYEEPIIKASEVNDDNEEWRRKNGLESIDEQKERIDEEKQLTGDIKELEQMIGILALAGAVKVQENGNSHKSAEFIEIMEILTNEVKTLKNICGSDVILKANLGEMTPCKKELSIVMDMMEILNE